MIRTLITATLFLLLQGVCTAADPQSPDRELVGKHYGAMGQLGRATEEGTVYFGENDCSLGGLEIKPNGMLVVSFAEKEEGKNKGAEFRRIKFTTVEKHISRAMTVWEPMKIGEDEYSATLHRYGKVFRVLVKLHRGDRVVSGIQWICAEPTTAEQTPAGDVLKAAP